MYTAFIFARSGSKGLPNKNIKLFLGKPLIAWAINQALSVKKIKRVIVSTDCKKIKKISESYGAIVPFLRPKYLAKDNSPEWLSWIHAIKFMEKYDKKKLDCFISLPTTSPLRKKIDIEKSIRMFEENLYDIVITASESSRNPSFNMVKINSKNEASLLLPHKNKIMNRQQASKTYDVGTSAYVADPNFILNNESIFDGKVGVLIIPKKRSIDIDDLIDFKIAEFLKLKKF
ncbi:acylneuraminate cytidylyltransferase family protein [Gammaproteobacteria bacterium]|nr:acylneuraminate cytidylyltransferase family protein [Gammaproteobacteria bacterium]